MTEKLCEGLDLTAADNVEYVAAYRNGSVSGVAVKCSGLSMMALTIEMVCKVLDTMHDPHLQASFFAAMFDGIKDVNVLNPIVDVAVSYDGVVMRKEKADDYSQ